MQQTLIQENNSDVIYSYDGSFDGFLSCVYESYYKKETPISMISDSEEQMSFMPIKDIYTSRVKTQRVKQSIIDKISKEALYMLQMCFLSNLENKEIFMLDFLKKGYKKGNQVCTMFGEETVSKIYKAVQSVHNEAHLFKGFIRFKDYKCMLVCSIYPKNNVLPIIAKHFVNRYPEENFIIYDKTHRLALVYKEYEYDIIDILDYQEAKISEEEQKFIDLWRLYLDTVAIKQRFNPKCQRSHMPKRYGVDLS